MTLPDVTHKQKDMNVGVTNVSTLRFATIKSDTLSADDPNDIFCKVLRQLTSSKASMDGERALETLGKLTEPSRLFHVVRVRAEQRRGEKRWDDRRMCCGESLYHILSRLVVYSIGFGAWVRFFLRVLVFQSCVVILKIPHVIAKCVFCSDRGGACFFSCPG